MAIAVEATRNLMATYYSTLVTHLSGHTASPSTTGANEMSGTGYARGAVTWGTAATSAITGTATIDIVNSGGTLTHVGGWSASTSGTFRDGFDVTDIVYPGDGTAIVTITYTQT